MGARRTTNLHLPSRVYQKHGAYYYVSKDKKWIYLGRRYPDAMQAYWRLRHIYPVIDDAFGAAFEPVTDAFMKALYRSLCRNATRRFIDVVLTLDGLMQMLDESGGICAVTAIPFTLHRPLGLRLRPWAPSVDRIDSRGPYIITNCQLVCAAYNIAKNEWPPEIWTRLVDGLKRGSMGKILDSPK